MVRKTLNEEKVTHEPFERSYYNLADSIMEILADAEMLNDVKLEKLLRRMDDLQAQVKDHLDKNYNWER